MNMWTFSGRWDTDENIGELILETLLSSNIESITDLNFHYNESWFKGRDSEEERFSNVNLLIELISKQTSLEDLDLSENKFSSSATETIVTRIAASATHSKL